MLENYRVEGKTPKGFTYVIGDVRAHDKWEAISKIRRTVIRELLTDLSLYAYLLK